MHGSYLKFLWSGDGGKSFYGSSLPTIKDVEEWKWLHNKVSKQIMMSSEFMVLSKQYALLLSQYGLSRNDVIHLIARSQNHIFGVLGGMRMIGGIIGFTEVSTNETILEQQLVETNANVVVCDIISAKTATKAITSYEASPKKFVKLVIFHELEGIENLIKKLEGADKNDDYGLMSESNIEEDYYLIFWNQNDNEAPTS